MIKNKLILLTITISYFLGYFTSINFRENAYYIVGFLLVLIPYAFFKIQWREALFVLLSVLVLFSFGVMNQSRVSRDNCQNKSSAWLNGWVTVVGDVVSLPTYSRFRGRRLVKVAFESHYLVKEGQRIDQKRKLLLNVPSEEGVFYPGMKLKIKGKLVTPRRATNRGQFDYQKFLRTQGISHILYVYDSRFIRVLEERSVMGRYTSLVREQIYKKIEEEFQGSITKSMVKAMLLGEKKEMTGQMRKVFQNSGTMHLLAVSGLHVSVLCLIIYFVLILCRISPLVSLMIVLACLFSFGLLVGVKIPIARSLTMFLLSSLVLLGKKRPHYFGVFLTTCLLFVVFFPWWVHSLSFQLSFLAVLGLFLFCDTFQMKKESHLIEKIKAYTFNAMDVSMAASLLVFPILASHFHVLTLVGLLSNIISIPFTVGILSMSIGWLMASFVWEPFGSFVGDILEIVIFVFYESLRWMSDLPMGIFYVRKSNGIELWIYYFVLVFYYFVSQRWFRNKYYLLFTAKFLILIIFILFHTDIASIRNIYNKNQIELFFLDCKSGPVMFIKLSDGNNILMNAGSLKPTEDCIWVTAPFLKSQGIPRIHYFFSSEKNPKKMNGLWYLKNDFKFSNFWFPNVNSSEISKLVPSNHVIKKKQIQISSGVFFSYFYAPKSGGYFVLNFEDFTIYVVSSWSDVGSILLNKRGKGDAEILVVTSDNKANDFLKLHEFDLVVLKQSSSLNSEKVVGLKEKGMLHVSFLEEQIRYTSYLDPKEKFVTTEAEDG